MNTEPVRGADPVRPRATQFMFSYRCGATECRIVVSALDGRYVSSFMVFEPTSTSIAHMALAVVHGTMEWVSEWDAVSRDLISELFAHTGPRNLPPSESDRDRLQKELAGWIRLRLQRVQAGIRPPFSA